MDLWWGSAGKFFKFNGRQQAVNVARHFMTASTFKIESPHIAAEIHYLPSKLSGRKSPVFSGYRGQFHINNSDWDAVQEFIDKDFCNPGESVKAHIRFATVHDIIPIAVGTTFKIKEGSIVVATGVVTVIIDKSILQSSVRRNLYREIDEITWNDWDPLGVNEFEEARDEYYSYLPEILSLVLKDANSEMIAQYLYKMETHFMGLPGNYETCLRVAKKLLLTRQ